MIKKVRKAVKQDIPGILELLVQVCMVHHKIRPDLFKGPATKYSGEEIEGLLEDPFCHIFVAENEAGKVLGHAFCIEKQVLNNPVLTDVRTLYIDDVCVDEAARGNGVGRALYTHVKEYAKDNGFYNITLNVWQGNDAALLFYGEMGLKPQKTCMEEILFPDA